MGFNTFPCNPYPISTEELNKGNNDELNTRVTALEGDVSDLEEQKANQITIALPFNAETAYEVGDLVYYNGLSYRCTNAHQGEWDADDFAGTTIANELSELKSGLTAKIDQIILGEVAGATFTDFVLGVIGAINIGTGKLTVVYAIHPNDNYYVFYIMHLYADIYMFTANNADKMFHGKADTDQNTVSAYEVTSVLIVN